MFTETIYMFGGWDGNHDLADLWSYHVPSQQWNCLSKNVEDEVTKFGFSMLVSFRLKTH